MLTGLNQLEDFIHTPSELPALVRVALIHYQFEAIHPFLDGNGRIGRLRIILLLNIWGLLPQPLLYLSTYFEANRQE
jgi:Fic family protein